MLCLFPIQLHSQILLSWQHMRSTNGTRTDYIYIVMTRECALFARSIIKNQQQKSENLIINGTDYQLHSIKNLYLSSVHSHTCTHPHASHIHAHTILTHHTHAHPFLHPSLTHFFLIVNYQGMCNSPNWRDVWKIWTVWLLGNRWGKGIYKHVLYPLLVLT